MFDSSNPDGLSPLTKSTIRRKGKAPHHAFLAGEARPFELPDDLAGPGPAMTTSDSDLPLRRSPHRKAPELPSHTRVQQDLEKRPDSSRARLGLRASMVVRPDQAPWDWQEFDKRDDSDRSAGPGSGLSMAVVPKGLGKVLGKTNR
jgi:hypothetical protein